MPELTETEELTLVRNLYDELFAQTEQLRTERDRYRAGLTELRKPKYGVAAMRVAERALR